LYGHDNKIVFCDASARKGLMGRVPAIVAVGKQLVTYSQDLVLGLRARAEHTLKGKIYFYT